MRRQPAWIVGKVDGRGEEEVGQDQYIVSIMRVDEPNLNEGGGL
jgi:hypothetical protein